MEKNSLLEKGSVIRDIIYSANDGIITTFAVVAGSFGASLSPRVVLILGFANLFADGLSMASGNYLGTKSEAEYDEKEKVVVRMVSPIKHSSVTFISFTIAGLIPLLPYVFKLQNALSISIVLVIISLFSIGVWRSRYSKRKWFITGFEMLAVGGIAALVAYFVGFVLDKYVGG